MMMTDGVVYHLFHPFRTIKHSGVSNDSHAVFSLPTNIIYSNIRIVLAVDLHIIYVHKARNCFRISRLRPTATYDVSIFWTVLERIRPTDA